MSRALQKRIRLARNLRVVGYGLHGDPILEGVDAELALEDDETLPVSLEEVEALLRADAARHGVPAPASSKAPAAVRIERCLATVKLLRARPSWTRETPSPKSPPPAPPKGGRRTQP